MNQVELDQITTKIELAVATGNKQLCLDLQSVKTEFKNEMKHLDEWKKEKNTKIENNETRSQGNKEKLDAINRRSILSGAGGGTLIFALIEYIKSLFNK